jgi:flavodoxin I
MQKFNKSEKTGIFYGSSTGNTESVARQIQLELGMDNSDIIDVASASGKEIDNYKQLIFGTSTWGIGDIQDDFAGFISHLSAANLSGKLVAIFGCGDQESYSDTFVDGMGEIWGTIKDKGCLLVGRTSNIGYSYDASKAEEDGSFVGLVIDEDNQSKLTDERIKKWVMDIII